MRKFLFLGLLPILVLRAQRKGRHTQVFDKLVRRRDSFRNKITCEV